MFYNRLIVLQKLKTSSHYHLLLGLKDGGKCDLIFWGYIFLVIICLGLHFGVVNFLNLTLNSTEGNPVPSRFSLNSNYSDSVGSNSPVGLKNFDIKKSIQASHHQGMHCTSSTCFLIPYHATEITFLSYVI